MSGIQKLIMAGFYAMAQAGIHQYAALSEEKKKELHRRNAAQMVEKALKGELEEPYREWEIDYIKENLGIDGAF